jgi:hypothetical protein
MKRSLLLLAVLLLAGCAPQAPQIPTLPPEYLNVPTPYIAPSYPTAEAQALSASQATGGVDIHLARAWQDGKQLNADVCFSLPDNSDWSIWKASLQFAGNVVTDFGTTLQSLQEPANGQPGQRCDTLNFYVPPDADLSSATISIDSIAALPREGEYCDVYLPKIQAALQSRGIAITIECVDQNGAQNLQITGFPADMTREQAEALVYSDEFYSIPGPWVFTFNLAQ